MKTNLMLITFLFSVSSFASETGIIERMQPFLDLQKMKIQCSHSKNYVDEETLQEATISLVKNDAHFDISIKSANESILLRSIDVWNNQIPLTEKTALYINNMNGPKSFWNDTAVVKKNKKKESSALHIIEFTEDNNLLKYQLLSYNGSTTRRFCNLIK